MPYRSLAANIAENVSNISIMTSLTQHFSVSRSICLQAAQAEKMFMITQGMNFSALGVCVCLIAHSVFLGKTKYGKPSANTHEPVITND
eukprot:UN00567